MIEFDDIQYLVLTRVPAITGRYEFLSFRQASQGRAWLAGLIDKVASARAVSVNRDRETRWVSIAFTWAGLRALGVDEASLATFPPEFRQGMAARYEVLGDTGRNHPDHWIGGLASQTCTPSPSCLPGILPSGSGLRASTRHILQAPPALSPVHPGFRCYSTLRRRARAFRVSRQADRAAD